MSAQKGNILVPLLTGVLILSLAAAGYLFWQTQQYQGEALGPYTPTNTPTPVPTTQDETENWKIADESLNIGITFKYPTNWYYLSSGSSQFPEITVQNIPFKYTGNDGMAPGQFTMILRATAFVSNMTELLNRLPKEGDYDELTGGKLKIYNQEQISVDGVPTLHRISGGVETRKAEEYFFLSKDRTISLFMEGNTVEPNRATLNQILSTFQFAN